MTRQEIFCAVAALVPVVVMLIVLVAEDFFVRRKFGDRLKRIEQDLYGTNRIRDVEPKE